MPWAVLRPGNLIDMEGVQGIKMVYHTLYRRPRGQADFERLKVRAQSMWLKTFDVQGHDEQTDKIDLRGSRRSSTWRPRDYARPHCRPGG